jgi:predicted TIM-barrel fold metal-dependent hydrolase
MSIRLFVLFATTGFFLSNASSQTQTADPKAMNFIDAHVHVWTPDTARYPLAPGFKNQDMKPSSFTPEELFKHCKPAGVTRINLIQMSFYGFDNSYMLDMIARYPDTFVGTAVINPLGKDPDGEMDQLAKKACEPFASIRSFPSSQ